MIRIAVEADIPAMLEIYGPYVRNTAYTFEYTVPTQEEFTRRFRDITAQMPWLVWEEDGAVLGYAYGSLPFERAAYAWCGEVSIYLAPEAQGRGIGRQLYTAVERIQWRQGYRVIYALITSENTGSLAFHQRMGYTVRANFENCGIKFGRRLGIIWMEKWSNAVDIPTEFPASWRKIVQSDEILTHILDNLTLS